MIRTEDLEKLAILAEVVDRLKERDSWVGRTHLQKAALFLQDLLDVPLDYKFVLYYYGPYSARLDDDIQMMRMLNIVDIEPMGEFGPRYKAGTTSLTEYRSSVATYGKQIAAIADFFGSKTAAEVELLATVFYVMHTEGQFGSELFGRVQRLKPRFSPAEIEQAIGAVSQFVDVSAPKELPF